MKDGEIPPCMFCGSHPEKHSDEHGPFWACTNTNCCTIGPSGDEFGLRWGSMMDHGEFEKAIGRGMDLHPWHGTHEAFGDLCTEVIELRDAIRNHEAFGGGEERILAEAQDIKVIAERIRRGR